MIEQPLILKLLCWQVLLKEGPRFGFSDDLGTALC